MQWSNFGRCRTKRKRMWGERMKEKCKYIFTREWYRTLVFKMPGQGEWRPGQSSPDNWVLETWLGWTRAGLVEPLPPGSISDRNNVTLCEIILWVLQEMWKKKMVISRRNKWHWAMKGWRKTEWWCCDISSWLWELTSKRKYGSSQEEPGLGQGISEPKCISLQNLQPHILWLPVKRCWGLRLRASTR